jgi:predicted phage terminase large subunit-like protein
MGLPDVKSLISPNQTDTISMDYERFADEVFPSQVEGVWKILPHTFAMKASEGMWKPFAYLVMISHVISTAIGMGGGRIAISVPPRHGKSLFLSKWLPTWFLENWPEERVILSTYEANFAASWGRQVRNVFRDDMGLLTTRLSEDSTSAQHWMTTKGGGMSTAGVGGPITGKGGKLVLVDDPHKNWQETQSENIRKTIQEWFDSTLYTRLEPGGTIVVLHTRWNEDDLIGWLLREKVQDGWFHIRIPAIAEEDDDPVGRNTGEALCPQRYDEKALARIKDAMNSMMWAALFQQRPAPMEGTTFMRDKWQYYKIIPPVRYILQSWDTASKKKLTSAYSVCQTWGVSETGFVLIDQWRARVEYPQLRKQAEIQYMKYGPNVVLVEDRDTGQALIQALQQETRVPVVGVYPDLDKRVRAVAISPLIESKRVFLPQITERTLWVDDFVNTCATFPNCLDFDEIDAMSQALSYLMSMATSGRVIGGNQRRTTKLLEGFRSLMT